VVVDSIPKIRPKFEKINCSQLAADPLQRRCLRAKP
jgi:hypothetical protein